MRQFIAVQLHNNIESEKRRKKKKMENMDKRELKSTIINHGRERFSAALTTGGTPKYYTENWCQDVCVKRGIKRIKRAKKRGYMMMGCCMKQNLLIKIMVMVIKYILFFICFHDNRIIYSSFPFVSLEDRAFSET